MSNENKFSAAVKRTLSEQVAFQCSVPSCRVTTTGPGENHAQTAHTGMACHIYSNAKSGPRGQGGLNSRELKSASNGIWCCYTHGKLIDTNAGDKYPAKMLEEWKLIHLARIEKSRSGINTHRGWFNKVSFKKGWLFKAGSNIEFGQITYVNGANGSGKTAICEWLAGYTGEQTLERWKKASSSQGDTIIEFDYFTPDVERGELRILNGNFTRQLNGIRLTGNAIKFSVVYLRSYSQFNIPDNDDVEKIALTLDLTKDVILQLIKDIDDDPIIGGYEFLVEEGNEDQKVQHNIFIQQGPPINALSGSEYFEAVLTLAIAHARNEAKFQPTLLVLDSIGYLDDVKMKKWGDYLFQQNFQTILFNCNPSSLIEENNWWEYEITRPKFKYSQQESYPKSTIFKGENL